MRRRRPARLGGDAGDVRGRRERGDRRRGAALDDVDRLTANQTANRLYNAACALALLGEDGRAVELLGRAVISGFPPSHAADDPDLASLRGRADFKEAWARPAVVR